MNTIVTSKEEILGKSRELIREKGWTAINIRSVAGACGVAVGSIYNYFGSKDALMAAIVESVWQDIFHPSEFAEGFASAEGFADTLACVRWLYQRIEVGTREYPGLSTLHPLVFAGSSRSDGKRRMAQAWDHILGGLRMVLKKDSRVRPDAFTEKFTEENFADLLFSLMVAALVRENFDCGPVLELVRRTVY